jgi:hypothetical protein
MQPTPPAPLPHRHSPIVQCVSADDGPPCLTPSSLKNRRTTRRAVRHLTCPRSMVTRNRIPSTRTAPHRCCPAACAEGGADASSLPTDPTAAIVPAVDIAAISAATASTRGSMRRSLPREPHAVKRDPPFGQLDSRRPKVLRVDLVGLNLGRRDRLGAHRVRHRHLPPKPAQQLGARPRQRHRLQHHVILRSRSREGFRSPFSIRPIRRISPSSTTHWSPPRTVDKRTEEAAGEERQLRIRARGTRGHSRGRPATNCGLAAHTYHGLPDQRSSRPGPGARAMLRPPSGRRLRQPFPSPTTGPAATRPSTTSRRRGMGVALPGRERPPPPQSRWAGRWAGLA